MTNQPDSPYGTYTYTTSNTPMEVISIRDWFAGVATDVDVSMASQAYMHKFNVQECSVAQARYFHADEMLKEREKPHD